MNNRLKFNSMIVLFLGILQLAVFTACKNTEAPDPSISVSLSSNTVKVGEPVTITIHQNTNNVCIYTGDSAHNYMNSAAYLLAGKSEQDLKNGVFLAYDSMGVVKTLDFNTISDPKLGGVASVVKVDSKGAYIAAPGKMDATLVKDTAKIGGNGKTVLSLRCTPRAFGGPLNQGLEVYPMMVLHQNKRCVIRLRFSTPTILATANSAIDSLWKPITNGIIPLLYINTKITAVDEGVVPSIPTSMSLSKQTDPSIVPQTLTSVIAGQYYQDLSFDLSSIVTDWEVHNIDPKTSKPKVDPITKLPVKMGMLTGIQFLFYGSKSAAFEGTVFVESVTVAGKDMPFDLGVNLPVSDNSGVLTYKHSFSKPGTYNVTVLGTSFGDKKYSGNGYQTYRGDNINASEYGVKYKNVTVPITVTP